MNLETINSPMELSPLSGNDVGETVRETKPLKLKKLVVQGFNPSDGPLGLHKEWQERTAFFATVPPDATESVDLCCC